MSIKTGGPAFPVTDVVGSLGMPYPSTFSGMDLRDYAAIHAATEDLALPDTVAQCAEFLGITVEDYRGEIHYPQVVAKARYIHADAMVAQRERDLA